MTRTDNKFPVEIFPTEIQRLIFELEKINSYPIDYSAAAILSLIAAAIGNTFKIVHHESYVRKPIFWIAVVGPKGSNKSGPVEFFMTPLIEADLKDQKKRKSLIAESKKNPKVDWPDLPPRKKRVINDTTLEGLGSVHEDNPKGVIIVVDELLSWINTFNRYSSGSTLENWLTIYNGGSISTTRKDEFSEYHVDSTCVNVIGTIQDKMLKKLFANDKSANGFVDRILFFVPKHTKIPSWDTSDLDSSLVNEIFEKVKKLIDREYNEDKDHNGEYNLYFDEDAKQCLSQWSKDRAAEDEKEQNQDILGIHAKLRDYTLKFCLILHVIDCIWKDKEVEQYINRETVLKAFKLYVYVDNCAKIAWNIASEARLASREKEFLDSLNEIFTPKEAYNVASKWYRAPEKWFQRFVKEFNNIYVVKTEGKNEYKKIDFQD